MDRIKMLATMLELRNTCKHKPSTTKFWSEWYLNYVSLGSCLWYFSRPFTCTPSQKSRILLWVEPVTVCATDLLWIISKKCASKSYIFAFSNHGQLLIWQREAKSVFTTVDSHGSFIVILRFSLSNLRLHPILTNANKKFVMISKVLQSMNLQVGNPP